MFVDYKNGWIVNGWMMYGVSFRGELVVVIVKSMFSLVGVIVFFVLRFFFMIRVMTSLL